KRYTLGRLSCIKKKNARTFLAIRAVPISIRLNSDRNRFLLFRRHRVSYSSRQIRRADVADRELAYTVCASAGSLCFWMAMIYGLIVDCSVGNELLEILMSVLL